jgi:hypothetical protein
LSEIGWHSGTLRFEGVEYVRRDQVQPALDRIWDQAWEAGYEAGIRATERESLRLHQEHVEALRRYQGRSYYD